MVQKYMLILLNGVLVVGMVLLSGCIGSDSGGQDKNKTNETNESSCDNNAGVCKVPVFEVPEKNNKTQNQ